MSVLINYCHHLNAIIKREGIAERRCVVSLRRYKYQRIAAHYSPEGYSGHVRPKATVCAKDLLIAKHQRAFTTELPHEFHSLLSSPTLSSGLLLRIKCVSFGGALINIRPGDVLLIDTSPEHSNNAGNGSASSHTCGQSCPRPCASRSIIWGSTTDTSGLGIARRAHTTGDGLEMTK